jgi:hypothetical protein
MSGESIRVGDWVRHPEFGEGLVLETKGAGDSASVVVSFADKSHRRLMVKFARLSRLENQPPVRKDPDAKAGVGKPRRGRKTKGS